LAAGDLVSPGFCQRFLARIIPTYVYMLPVKSDLRSDWPCGVKHRDICGCLLRLALSLRQVHSCASSRFLGVHFKETRLHPCHPCGLSHRKDFGPNSRSSICRRRRFLRTATRYAFGGPSTPLLSLRLPTLPPFGP